MSVYGADYNRNHPAYKVFIDAIRNAKTPYQAHQAQQRPSVMVGYPPDRYQPPHFQEAPKKMGLLKKILLVAAGLWLGKKLLNHLPSFPWRKETQGEGLNTLA